MIMKSKIHNNHNFKSVNPLFQQDKMIIFRNFSSLILPLEWNLTIEMMNVSLTQKYSRNRKSHSFEKCLAFTQRWWEVTLWSGNTPQKNPTKGMLFCKTCFYVNIFEDKFWETVLCLFSRKYLKNNIWNLLPTHC